MIGRFVSPLLLSFCKKLRAIGDEYGVTKLSYQILILLSFLSAPAFAAVQMNIAALISFLFCVMAHKVFVLQSNSAVPKETLFLYGLCGISVFGTAFGVAENFGMPIAFLFLSWMILNMAYSVKPDGFRLVDGFEIGLATATILFAPIYTPAIAILFGLACLASAGIIFLIDFKRN